MNEIDAWLACDEDGYQCLFFGFEPYKENGVWYSGEFGEILCEVNGHDIQPGECRPVRLRVEVVKDGE